MITYETLKSFCAKGDNFRPALNYAIRRAGGWWAANDKNVMYVPMEHVHPNDMRFLCDEIPENLMGTYPNMENVIDVHNFIPAFVISVDTLKETIASLPLTEEYKDVVRDIVYITCPECQGDGELTLTEHVVFNGLFWDLEANHECPVCQGYGKIPDFDGYDPTEDDYDPEKDVVHVVSEKTGAMVPDLSAIVHFPGIAYMKAVYINGLLKVAREQMITEIECSGGNYNDCVVFRLNGVYVGIMPQRVVNENDNTKIVNVKL